MKKLHIQSQKVELGLVTLQPSPLREEKNMNMNSHILENLYELIMRA